ncbi:Aerotaxis receptor [Hydrogenophaga sp. T4]|nr:Aerotaxis receptor [Hydrogenophaga sp. T4]
MRLNLPVTQREYAIPEDATLVSTTDLQSRITYCNPAFIAVSGYDKEELIGQTHNIVRHPDMPTEAFRDMWETLKSGQPWSALVKNRRKNGDHYWVLANATPIMEAGQPVGYMSVRTQPTREQIAQAESLYARMRSEADRGARHLALHQGRVVRTGWRGSLQRLVRPTLARKMGAITIALVVLVQLVDSATEGMGASVHVASLRPWSCSPLRQRPSCAG